MRTICDVCSNLKEQSKMNLTLLFFYGTPYSSIDEYDITLVTQFSHWNGPASIIVYGNESEKWNFMQFLNTYSELDERSNVVMHFVYKRNGYYYPINYLRNTALSAVKLSRGCYMPIIASNQGYILYLYTLTHRLIRNY